MGIQGMNERTKDEETSLAFYNLSFLSFSAPCRFDELFIERQSSNVKEWV